MALNRRKSGSQCKFGAVRSVYVCVCVCINVIVYHHRATSHIFRLLLLRGGPPFPISAFLLIPLFLCLTCPPTCPPKHPQHPLTPPLQHLTTRCGNPITHVRIPAGEEREGGRMWTEDNCVKASGLNKTVGHSSCLFFQILV